MVWGAPTSWSSGGRSAVHTSRGTPAASASATAACSSAAAVPLVVTTSAGRPVARPRPRATKAAERSSSTTWVRQLGPGGQGQGERGRSGPRRDDGVGEAAAQPLVDDGGAERGVEDGDGQRLGHDSR